MRGDRTWLEESVKGSLRHLADAQSALRFVEEERDENCSRLDIEEQRCGGLEAWLCSLLSCFVDHISLVYLVRDPSGHGP